MGKNQDLNKNIIVKCNDRLRELLCQIDGTPMYIEMAVYFKELNYQIDRMDFVDDWKTYYYEFGILFSLLDITKECFKKTKMLFKSSDLDPLYNFNFDKYIQCDDNNKINHFFYNYENFISTLRCLIIAHPINSNKTHDKTEYYSLNEISIDEDSIANALMPNKVQAKKDYIKFKIQKYYWNEEESIKSLFSIAINNIFIGKYYEYVSNYLITYLNTLETVEQKNKREHDEFFSELEKEKDNFKKLTFIRKAINREYKHDIDLGFIPFDIKIIDATFKNKDSFISDYLINTFVDSFKRDDYFNCIDLNLYENESKDYKYTTYWFEDINLSDQFSFEKAVFDANNYYVGMSNERFTYYFKRFLFNVFNVEEIKDCKTYYDIFSKIIRKELELRCIHSNAKA